MRLIINADDFGLSQSVNDAIIELAELGTVTSTTVMVNMPFYSQAQELLKFERFSIGLHVNLTQGKPVSDPAKIPSLVNNKGEFYQAKELRKKAIMGLIKLDEVYFEIRNQYDLLYSIVGERLTHFDSHQDILKFGVIAKALIKLKKTLKTKKAVRVYNKYFIITKNNTIKLELPDISKLGSYGIMRVLIESLLVRHTKMLGKHFEHGDGFILTDTCKAIDILGFMATHNDIVSDKTVEICCHPAIGTNDLPKTTLRETRLNEYLLLKSGHFSLIRNNCDLVSYIDVIELSK